jgi:hypothetical protein
LEECKMATVGQQLTAPEAGWKRYDDTDKNISYIGNWISVPSSPVGAAYSGSYIHNNTIGNCVRFKFTGSKIRIIHYCCSNNSKNIEVNIDGQVSTYSASYIDKSQVLVFEKLGLSDSEHYIILTNKTSAYQTFDAVDIDESGELKPFIAVPTDLTATLGDSQVTLSWTAVNGSTKYNVKRSTTSGGLYTTIASNVSGTSYVDSGLSNGTTYYYVVTAITSDGESGVSDEAFATPIASEKELLRITMIDSSEREYRLTDTEVNGFVNWYNHHVSTDTMSYAINDSVDRSKEYLSFDKIISFKVIPTVE